MIEVGGAGVDCFVCSANLTDPVADELAAIVVDQMAKYELEGLSIQQATQNGFDGLRVGSMFYGRNADYVMVDIKGDDSDDFAAAAKLRAGGIQCSRIDTRVDATGHPRGSNPAREAYGAFESRGYRAQGKRRMAADILCDSDGGYCFYTGAKRSDCRTRLYDKYAESPHGYKPGTFRYENQSRRERANNIWRGITQAADQRQFCLEVTKEIFEAHGTDMSFLKGVQARKVVVPRPPTDIDTFLAWHGRCVAPTLIKYAAQGQEERILAELARIQRSIEKQLESRELLSGAGAKVFKPRGSRRVFDVNDIRG